MHITAASSEERAVSPAQERAFLSAPLTLQRDAGGAGERAVGWVAKSARALEAACAFDHRQYRTGPRWGDGSQLLAKQAPPNFVHWGPCKLKIFLVAAMLVSCRGVLFLVVA